MSNVFLRHAAPWACAWFMGLPTAHAAESVPPAQAVAAPFKQYQGWRDEPLQDWREANERVGAIGGWRSYLREAQPDDGDADHARHDHHGH